MAPTQRQRNGQVLHQITSRRAESRPSVRKAAVAASVRIRAQESSNRKSPRRRGGLTAMGETGLNSDNVSHHRHPRRVALPQRRSLRHALRESLKFPDGITYRGDLLGKGTGISLAYPAVSVDSPNNVYAESQLPLRESAAQTRGARDKAMTTTPNAARSTEPAILSVSLPQPQRSSLRRAIRESLAAGDTGNGNPVLEANDLKLKPAKPILPSPVSGKKSGLETQYQAINERNESSHLKARAGSQATPQQSSLRRVLRESKLAAAQGVGATSHGISSCLGVMSTNTIKKPSDGKNSGAIRLSDSQSAVSPDPTDLSDRGIFETPSQIAPTISAFVSTTRPHPFPVKAPRPPPISPSLEGVRLKSSMSAKVPTSGPLLLIPQPFPYYGSATDVSDKSDLPEGVRSNGPGSPSLGGDIRDSKRFQRGLRDSQFTSHRKGWHRVHQIVNEAPGGLYLVEWEDRDPRTGYKWPASWVKAKNITASAIREWEKEKHAMLLETSGSLADCMIRV